MRQPVLIFLMLAMVASAASATTLVPLTPQQLRERATSVILATIDHEETFWDEETGLPRTDLVLRDVALIEGHGPAPSRLTYTGGKWGEQTLSIAGMPRWPIGEPLVLFIEADGERWACPTVGWQQGIFRAEELTGRLVDGFDRGISLEPDGTLRISEPAEPGLDMPSFILSIENGTSR